MKLDLARLRSREFEADRYAARLGQGEALSRFLEQHVLEYDLPSRSSG